MNGQENLKKKEDLGEFVKNPMFFKDIRGIVKYPNLESFLIIFCNCQCRGGSLTSFV